MNGDIDPTDSVRTFSYFPIGIDSKPVSGNMVPGTKLADEIGHTACYRTNEQFNRTHPGIGSAIVNRLVSDDTMLAVRDVVACAAVVGRREPHRRLS